MSLWDLPHLFRQFRPVFRWGFLLLWNAVAVGSIVWAKFGDKVDMPLLLELFVVAGLSLGWVGFGLLISSRVRRAVLYQDYSLEGYRLSLGVAAFAGILIALGAGILLIFR